MTPSTSKLSGLYYLTDTDGDVIETPAGHPVGCVDRQIVELAADAYTRYGSDPQAACSLYALLCTYIEFGGTPSAELADALLKDLEDDIVYREVAYRTAMEGTDAEECVLGSPWPDAYLQSSGFLDNWEVEAKGGSRIVNYSKISDWLLGELQRLPPRALLTLVYCSANWRAMLPALALVLSDYSAEDFTDLVGDEQTGVLKHLSSFAALPEDRDAVIKGVHSSSTI